jgi:hypothetical protein
MTNSAKERHTYGYEFDRTRGCKVGTLWCEIRDDISGDVTLSLEFDGWPYQAKIDFLHDIMGLLTLEYKKIRNEDRAKLQARKLTR